MKREHDDMNDDEDIGALLRQVGARREPSAAEMEEVRRAVHDEWRATVARQTHRNRVVAFGLAASVALVLVVAGWALRFSLQESELPVAIARIDGEARLQISPTDPIRTVNVGENLAVGGVLSTDDRTRVAMVYGADVSIRIDRGSRIQRVAPDRFRLANGAVYIDAHPQARDHDLIIETPAGETRHLGTQYQVRQLNETVEVSIREGVVEIIRPSGAALVSAGERVRLNPDGGVERDAISAQDPAWDWAEAASPPFAIDDRTVDEFLQWAARETGRQVAYASAEAQRVAQTVRLRGSVETLDPDTALSAVLSTTEFERYETGDDLIAVRLTVSDQ